MTFQDLVKDEALLDTFKSKVKELRTSQNIEKIDAVKAAAAELGIDYEDADLAQFDGNSEMMTLSLDQMNQVAGGVTSDLHWLDFVFLCSTA